MSEHEAAVAANSNAEEPRQFRVVDGVRLPSKVDFFRLLRVDQDGKTIERCSFGFNEAGLAIQEWPIDEFGVAFIDSRWGAGDYQALWIYNRASDNSRQGYGKSQVIRTPGTAPVELAPPPPTPLNPCAGCRRPLVAGAVYCAHCGRPRQGAASAPAPASSPSMVATASPSVSMPAFAPREMLELWQAGVVHERATRSELAEQLIRTEEQRTQRFALEMDTVRARDQAAHERAMEELRAAIRRAEQPAPELALMAAQLAELTQRFEAEPDDDGEEEQGAAPSEAAVLPPAAETWAQKVEVGVTQALRFVREAGPVVAPLVQVLAAAAQRKFGVVGGGTQGGGHGASNVGGGTP